MHQFEFELCEKDFGNFTFFSLNGLGSTKFPPVESVLLETCVFNNCLVPRNKAKFGSREIRYMMSLNGFLCKHSSIIE